MIKDLTDAYKYWWKIILVIFIIFGIGLIIEGMVEKEQTEINCEM